MKKLQVKRNSDLRKFTFPRRKLRFKIYIYLYKISDLRKSIRTHISTQTAKLTSKKWLQGKDFIMEMALELRKCF